MAKAWYPVIDYSSCAECGTCIGQCNHGVYDAAKAPTPVVIHPAGCIDHCHGCGNLCPEGAITYVGDDTGWVPPKGSRPLSVQAECGCALEKGKKIAIDFLYLDLHTCERCMATDTALDEAVSELYPVLRTLGYEMTVRKLNITSPEMAEEYGFVSSPTIRVNGRDICTDVKENNCKDCGDLCGSDMECRVFVYEGTEYDQPPKAMIEDGILKAIYARQPAAAQSAYALPGNLKTFFSGKKSSCCDGSCNCTGG